MLPLGPLKARIFDVDAQQKVERVVVLMHGFGAPGDDLVALGQELHAKKGTRFVFPEAPLDMGGGRAWWLIDWTERSRYEQRGDQVGYSKLIPSGLPEASVAVNGMLDAIEKEWAVPAEHIVLGGFSQGSMIALDAAMQRPKKPGALVLLSSSLVATPRLSFASLKGLPVFMSHGRADPVLPFFVAEKLRDELRSAGVRVAWHAFSGGHAIPFEVLKALGGFLDHW